MTRLDPSLRLSRLVVLKDGQRAYDEAFHAGVNIIRGVPGEGNSVGKSTIADMIFFALGGDLTTWKEEAGLCDEVLAEVHLSGSTATLRRLISDSTQQPMWIHFGNFDSAISSAADGWQRYTYRRVSDRESFSQVLFRALGMPEVPGDADANITMHQLLRLMYVDQLTPVDRIFKFENRDSSLRRQAVGDLLCGAYDDRIYPAQLQLRDSEKHWEAATHEFNTLLRVLTASGEGYTLDFIRSRQDELSAERSRTAEEISKLKRHRFDDSQLGTDHPPAVTEIKTALDKVNADITAARVVEGQLTYEVADSGLLLDEITRTLERLKQGEIALSAIGPIDFQFCPSCFAPLSPADAENHCKLCRRQIEGEGENSRVARMRNELEIQFKESSQLQADREVELAKVRADIASLSTVQKALSVRFAEISLNFVSETDARIDSLTSRLGYLDREIVDLERERKIADQIDNLSAVKGALNEEISRLKHNIQVWKDQRDRRQGQAYSVIASMTAKILGMDLHTEEEFSEDCDVNFSFADDRVSVNGKTGFSASSLTVLRNSFHLAMHWASCVRGEFRYPRFLVMDNIEDKGMTEQRSQNFQRLIVSLSESIEVEHQIIFTTSMIAPELNISALTVGDLYTFENKSLKIGRKQSSLAPQAAQIEYGVTDWLAGPEPDVAAAPMLLAGPSGDGSESD